MRKHQEHNYLRVPKWGEKRGRKFVWRHNDSTLPSSGEGNGQPHPGSPESSNQDEFEKTHTNM